MVLQAKHYLNDILQKALNQYLLLDPESRTRLFGLNGKLVALELLPLKVTFYLSFSESRAHLALDSKEVPETKIKGTPLRLVMLAFAPHTERKRFFADDVTMEGNAILGQQVIALFDQLQIDWEELTAKLIGDVPAHHAGNIVRGAREWVDKTRAIFVRNLNEYLHEEINIFPSAEALQDFFKEVDSMRMNVDRLQARVKYLQQQLSGQGDL